MFLRRLGLLIFALALAAGAPAQAATNDFDLTLVAGSMAVRHAVPQVVVSNAENNWVQTTAASIALSGYYSGSGTLTWKNVTNNTSGAVTGTYSFTSAAIPLAVGDNEIRFLTGAKVLETVHVTRNPLEVTSLPTFSVGQVAVMNPTTVYCTLGVGIQTGQTYTVTLYASDAQGQLLTQLGVMKDDGDYLGASGDDILNDGVFTAKMVLTPPAEGIKYYRAVVTTGQNVTARSALGSLAVYAPPTQAQAQQAQTVGASIMSAWQNMQPAAAGFSTQESYAAAVSSAQDGLVAYINGMDNALFATKGDNGVVFAFKDIPFLMIQKTIADLNQWSSGLDGAASSAQVAATAPAASAPRAAPVADRSGGIKTPPAPSRYPDFTAHPGAAGKQAAADDKNIIKNKRALFLDPYYWQHVNSTKMNDANGPWTVIVNSEKPKLETNVVVNGSDASANVDPHLTETKILDAYKTLSQYGTVVLHTHGAFWTFSNPNWLAELTTKVAAIASPSVKAAMETVLQNIKNSMMTWNGKMVLLTTGTYVGTDLNAVFNHAYSADIVTGRLVVATDGEMMVTPWFIDRYNNAFPNSLIWLGACHSLQNDTLGSVFLKDGAGALFGFSESVIRSWNVSRGGVVLTNMLTNKKTAKQAFDEAVKTGNNDGHGTSLILSGNNDLRYDNGLQNPDFEDPNNAGSLQSWTVSGDARAIKSMQDDTPTSGHTMAIISSGLGRTSTYGAFSQSFTAPANATTMTFGWNFYSAEFMDWCNSQYDDTFRVLINGVTVFQESVNTLCSSGLTEVSPIDDKGDCFKTGWRQASVNIAAYANQDVTLRFEVQDKGDEVYDTAVLVDNIVINTAP